MSAAASRAATSAPPPWRPWAIVPAKAFARAKSRLDAVIAPAARRELARVMLDRVLAACRAADVFAGILVATDGDDVARSAARARAHVVRDRVQPAAPLAAVVDAALEASIALGASHAVVVMADLPRLQARDLRELTAALRATPYVLAPDHQRRGTNALAVQLDLGLRSCFGRPDSLTHHVRAGLRAGVRPQLLNNPRLAADLDTHADWLRLAAAGR